ncbi:MAG TPA: hypothetical protein VJW95_02215, partial [Dissulfurispiraceae bacterium]|nr:hypothetical protein [Dissulfurispiraceae bacterium]
AFKETITFAKIYKSDIIESDAEKPEELELPQKEDNMNTISDKQQLPKIPICTYGFTEEVLALFPTRPKLSFRILSIKGDTEVTQSDIDQLISYLNLYKKGFPIDESSKQ